MICAVQGEHALEAATSAAPLLKKGAHYLDLCTVTGRMSDEDRAQIETAGGRYIDIAVMGGFFKQGIKAPMLVAGEDVEPVVAWMNANGFVATLLGPKPGSASSVKMLRRVIVKGIEALGVEALVAAERQGILEGSAGLPGRRRRHGLRRLHHHAGADACRACPSPLGGDGPGRPDPARDRRRSADDRGDREEPSPHRRRPHRAGRRQGAEPRRGAEDPVGEGHPWPRDVFDRLVALLTEAKAKFRVIEHEAEGHSEKISVIRGNRPDQAAKAMVLDVRGGGGGRRHVLAILPGSRKLDFAAVADAVRGAQVRLRLARHGAGADRLRHGRGAALRAQSRARRSWSRRTCSPTRRCSSTPAASTARWNSTPGTGSPSPSRASPGSRRRD